MVNFIYILIGVVFGMALLSYIFFKFFYLKNVNTKDDRKNKMNKLNIFILYGVVIGVSFQLIAQLVEYLNKGKFSIFHFVFYSVLLIIIIIFLYKHKKKNKESENFSQNI